MRKESLDGDRIFVVHDFLSADECHSFIAALHYDGCFRRRDGEQSQLTFMTVDGGL